MTLHCNTLDEIVHYNESPTNETSSQSCAKDIIGQMKAGTFKQDIRQVNRKLYEKEKRNLDINMFFLLGSSLALFLINTRM